MSAVSAMDAALYTALNTGTVVGVGKASAVYRGMAPLTATFPLVIFALMDGDDNYVLGGRGYVRLNYSIRVVYEGLSAAGASTLADAIDTLLTNVTLTVTGHTMMVGRRVRLISYPESVEGGVTYQHVGGEYEFMLDPA